jgi:gas vesicle protein
LANLAPAVAFLQFVTVVSLFCAGKRVSGAVFAEGGNLMKTFLFGLGLGIGLGVLFAPMSGKATRNNLSERASDVADSARESYEQGRDRVQRGVEAIRGTAERAVGQARAGFNDATGTDL